MQAELDVQGGDMPKLAANGQVGSAGALLVIE
jgi:hypothetical protein